MFWQQTFFYTEKNWPSSFFNNVNLRLTVFSFTSAKLVWQQSHYAKLKKYWIIYLESYVFANSLSRNIFREIAKKKRNWKVQSICKLWMGSKYKLELIYWNHIMKEDFNELILFYSLTLSWHGGLSDMNKKLINTEKSF